MFVVPEVPWGSGFNLRIVTGEKHCDKAAEEFIDACKTNVPVSFFRDRSNQRFVSGHDFSRAINNGTDRASR